MFWAKHPAAEQPLRAWFAEAEQSTWHGPSDVKERYRSADFLPGNRIIFNIKGNAYRLIVAVQYAPLYVVYIRFVGTHAEYDRVDAETI